MRSIEPISDHQPPNRDGTWGMRNAPRALNKYVCRSLAKTGQGGTGALLRLKDQKQDVDAEVRMPGASLEERPDAELDPLRRDSYHRRRIALSAENAPLTPEEMGVVVGDLVREMWDAAATQLREEEGAQKTGAC